MLKVSHHRQRQFQGCFYLGCFAPLAFALLAGMIVAKAISDVINRKTTNLPSQHG